jgi:hypothetical protein
MTPRLPFHVTPRPPSPLVAVLPIAFGLAACGVFEQDKVSVGEGNPDDVNGGLLDGGVLPDGAVIGGGNGMGDGDGDGNGSGDGDGDGDTRTGFLDGGFLPDGAPIDGLVDGGTFEPEIDISTCTVGEDDQYEFTVPFVEGGYDLAPGPVDFGFAYYRDGDCKHIIDTAIVSSSEGAPEPASVIDDCRTIREVSIANTFDGWWLAWTDNYADRIELFSVELDETLQIPSSAERRRITDNMFFEKRPVLADVAGSPLLAWYEERTAGRAILTSGLEDADTPREVIAAGDGRQPIELALAQVGMDNAALAWVEEVANRGVWLQALDGAGAKVGVPVQLTDFAAPGSTVDIATRDRDGAGVIYSQGIDQVNFEVRFRRLHDDASLWGEEVKVISRPLQAKDAGIARIGGGYVVAYRAIPNGGTITEPQVRLAFISKEGNVTKDANGRVVTFPVVPATRDGSQIEVQASTDGQLMLAFVDGNDDAGNALRVVRRRLDCSF